MSMSEANVLLWRLLDNSEAEEAEGYNVACDECAGLVNEDEYSENDGLCTACHGKVHFVCPSCGDTFHQDDRSKDYPELCVDCASERHRTVADGLWSELEELAGIWSGEDHEIERLKKLLNYARRLK